MFSNIFLNCNLLKPIKSGYYLKKGKVSYIIHDFYDKGIDIDEIVGADSKSFKQINKWYAKDKFFAYYKGMKIDNSDGPSFELINEVYCKDKNHIYYLNKPLINADVNTFQVTKSYCIGTDKNRIYYRDSMMSEKSQSFKIILTIQNSPTDFDFIYTDNVLVWYNWILFNKKADPKTFEKINKFYFKDKNYVYKIPSENKSSISTIIEKADPKTFEIIFTKLNAIYAKDKNYCYYDNALIPKANPNTFRIINENYSTDEVNVFFDGNYITSDYRNFKIILHTYIGYKGIGYSKDSKNVYYNEKIISNDPINFNLFSVSLAGDAYSKDSKAVYHNGEKVDIENIDINSFISLNEDYAKDKYRVYHILSRDISFQKKVKVLEGADANTFKLVQKKKFNAPYDAIDKNYKYKFGTKIINE